MPGWGERAAGVVLALCLAASPSAGAAENAAEVLRRAEAALSAGRAREATDLFKKARKLDPALESDAAWGLARVAFASGDRKKAVAAADEILALPAPAKRRAQALTLKGVALSKGTGPNELDEAEAAFRAATEADPRDPTPLYNLGVLQLTRGRTEEGLATLGRCREVAPSSDLARRAERVTRNPRVAGKTLAPEFRVTTLTGQELTLRDLEGRVVLLDFWATWCPPCVASIGELRDLRKAWPEDRLAVVSISVDRDDDAWRSFVAGNRMSWPQYRDVDERLTQAFRVSSFPTYVLLDGDGVEVRRVSGLDEHQSIGFRLRKELEGLLGRPR
jgi:thioredoxin-like negative regulator of GroEL